MDKEKEIYIIKLALFELYQNSIKYLQEYGTDHELECCKVAYKLLKQKILIDELKNKNNVYSN